LGRLFVIFGPSGVGKGSIEERLLQRDPLQLSVSATTRPARPDERDGEDYHFVDETAFDSMLASGGFLEWAEYSGHRYGTPRKAVLDMLAAGNDVLLEIELQGARQVRASHPEAVLIFVAPPSPAALEARLRDRGDTGEREILRRLEIAAWEIEEARDLYDHVVVNDDLEQAVTEVAGIIVSPFQE